MEFGCCTYIVCGYVNVESYTIHISLNHLGVCYVILVLPFV
jgi:hypothetical protein